MALSKTGRSLSKAEILGVGVFSPLPSLSRNVLLHVLAHIWVLTPCSDTAAEVSEFRAGLSKTDQGPLNGGVSNGGVSRSGLVLPFLSCFCPFWDFPEFSGIFPISRGWSGNFPDLSFSSFSAY